MNLSQSIAFDRAILAGGPGSGRHASVTKVEPLSKRGMYRIHYSDGAKKNGYYTNIPGRGLPKVGDKKGSSSSLYAGGPGSGRHPEYGDMHKILVKKGYRLHPSGNPRQDYIHPEGVHIQVNPATGGWRRAEYPDHEGGHGAKTLNDYLHGRQHKIAAGGPGSGRHKELIGLKIAHTGGGVYVARTKEGKVIGTANLDDSRRAIGNVFVDPNFRRQGVATQLYRFIEKHIDDALWPGESQTKEGAAFWKSRNSIKAGGPGSGRHAELWKIHDELKDSPLRMVNNPSSMAFDRHLNQLEELHQKLSETSNGNFSESLENARNQLNQARELRDPWRLDVALSHLHHILSHITYRDRKLAAGSKSKKINALFNPDQPRDDHGRWASNMGGGVTHRTITDSKGRTVEVYSKNGVAQAAIPRSEYPLTPEQEEVERRFSQQIGRDPERWKREYLAKRGNVLNADYAKELSPDYMKDKTLAMAVHEPASWLIKQIWKDELNQVRPEKANVALFTAGGAGSGKTSSITDPETKATLEKAQIVYDGTLRPATKAIARVKQALEAGKDGSVLFVDRDHVASFRDGMLGRAARDEAATGSGRIVTLPEFVAQHSSIRDSMKQLVDTFKDHPRFSFGVIDNNRGPGEAKRTTLDALPPAKSAPEMFKELKGVLDEEYAKGNISQKIYKAVLDGGEKAMHKEIGV